MADNSGLFSIPAFKNRGIIKLAPDALVYINGAAGASVIAPVTGKDTNVTFRDGITSISIQSNIEPAGSSSATIEITTPIYNEKSNYWVMVPSDTKKTLWVPIFVPMMEVKIYLKGRYLVDMTPRYYPVFWGMITSVTESYNSGMWKISLSCGDMLTWWRYSVVNINPGIAETNVPDVYLEPPLFRTIFTTTNPYGVIYSLTLNMGQYGFITPADIAQDIDPGAVYPNYAFMSDNIMKYWKNRFNSWGTFLKMYGAKGERIIFDTATMKSMRVIPLNPIENITDHGVPENQTKSNSKARTVTQESHSDRYDLYDIIAGYPSGAAFDRMGVNVASTYQSKLEFAIELTKKIDFEFYLDVNGELVFKPPFYNVNTSSVEPYVVRSNDIISCAFTTDSDAIKTALKVYGVIDTYVQEAQSGRSIGMHYEIDLAAKYGLRYDEITLEYIGKDSNLARIFAMSRLACINAKATTGIITIPGRPELRLGYPIYLEYRDSFHYVRSINHSFDFGGTYSTSLSLEGERTKQYSFSQNNFEILKNKIYVLTDSTVSLQVSPIEQTVNESNSHQLLASMERVSSLKQGRYEIQDLKEQEQITATKTSIPFTDENGYRLIGAFPYGRGMPVNPEGLIDPTISNIGNLIQDTADKITIGATTESQLMKPYFNNKIDGFAVAGIVNQYIDIKKITSPDISPDKKMDDITKMNPESTGIIQKNNKLISDLSKPGSR